MKLSDGFVVREILDEAMLVPVGSKVIEFKGLMTLSPTALFVYRRLERGQGPEDILAAMLDEYEVDEATARRDLLALLAEMASMGVLADE